jgi:hypothetical protein
MTKARDLANLGNKTSLDEINDAYDAGALSNTNILINGSFTVSQRGNYTSATAIGNTHTYYLDRWKSRANTVSGTLTHSTGYPFTRSQTALLTATSAGTGYMQMDQLVETNFYQGQTVVLSAWVKSNTPNARIGCYTGTWSSAAIHSGNGSWEKLSVSFTVGTGYATPLVRLGILSDGSWDVVSISSGDYIEVSEVQLEVGDTATPFEHRSYGEELAKCQRYYYRVDGAGDHTYNAYIRQTSGSGTQQYAQEIALPVTMRSAPTATVSYQDFHKPGIRYDTISSVLFDTSKEAIGIRFNVAVSDTNSISGQVRFLNVTADAEL